MFDFHLHSSISFDSECSATDIIKKAENIGLKEICFTDHYDYNSDVNKKHELFDLSDYSNAYDDLTSDSVLIRRGVEFSLTDWNLRELDLLLTERNFDFVIGSVHYVDGYDPYEIEYWNGISVKEGYEKYLKRVLECVKKHSNFDVLGHLTYVSKSPNCPIPTPVDFNEFQDITDEIMKILVSKGIGMEINTSGVDKVGVFLPDTQYLKRFKELGGEIVTVGSDSHDALRVGQYSKEALEILKDLFGYVCTFEKRRPIFHKL